MINKGYVKEEAVMLLEFSCSNHKSIKRKITFSTIASKDTKYENELKEFLGDRVLRSAAIYGANGSGKSNFINAISFVKDLVISSMNYQPGEDVFQAPHKLSKNDDPSSYSIQFVIMNVRYAYGFSIKNNLIYEEYLYYFPKGRQVKIFERKGVDVYPGDKYKRAYEVSLSVLKENRLFLSCAANYTNIKEIENAFLFFRNEIIIYNPSANNWTEYSIQLMQKDAVVKKRFVDILELLGTGIKDINVKLEKKLIDITELPKEIPDAIKSFFSSGEAEIIDAKLLYDGFQTDLISEESTGIKKLFEIICPIIDILSKGKILICDEIETGLHEAVVYEIIKLFKYADLDNFAQLIFTTHDTSLLDSNLFRRDQVWFTQLDNERATDLYSLAEVKNVRKNENLAKGYVSGKYGAIPMLNKNHLELFFEERHE